MQLLSLAHQTMFAELVQRCLDAEFDDAFPENGSFTRVTGRNGQQFWYYKGYRRGADDEQRRWSRYVGPVADAEVTARVERFRRTKQDYVERRSMVTSLLAVGLPAPPEQVGEVLDGLWRGGLFRLHGVLIGTAAFQAYGGLLGRRLPAATLMTGDVDVAQFHSVSVSVDDTMPPMLETLRQVDGTFREIPHLLDPLTSTGFRNARGLRVEFLTPNRGRADHGRRPARMSALGGAAAQPLRYLDFLLHRPVRSALLHRGGIAVLVPAPERYAVHKLLLSTLRRRDRDGAVKARKDLSQSAALIDALVIGPSRIDLGSAWREARARGPKWRAALDAARSALPEDCADALDAASAAARDIAGDADGPGLRR
ncbi:MAG: GSU2403 family nucleotidyltransferase fold protein [Gammaproteobacteria bacterium]